MGCIYVELYKRTTKKHIAVFAVIVLLLVGTIQNSGWEGEHLIVFRWVRGKGLRSSFERSSLEIESAIFPDGYFLEYVKPNEEAPIDAVSNSLNLEVPVNTLVIIQSQPNHTNFRATIRNTWGSSDFLMPRSIKIYFFMEYEDVEQNVLEDIIKESEKHKDLVIIDDATDCFNSVEMLRIISQCCLDKLEYVIKTSDNVYLNLPYLHDYLPTSKTGLMMGYLNSTLNIKWPNKPDEICFLNYTEYLVGSTYVMSIDVVERLYLATNNILFLDHDYPEENKYVTGILPSIAKVTLSNHQMFTYIKNITHPCILRTIVVSHNLTTTEIVTAYNQERNVTECAGTIYFTPTDGVYYSSNKQPGPSNPYGSSIEIRDKF